MPEIYGSDCYSPKEIAERVENVGVTKANLPLVSMIALGVMAGAFIGLGAMYSTIVASDSTLPFAISRILAGLTFSLGLILVVIAGAELFTGNNLLVMAWVAGRIPGAMFARNLCIVFLANLVGASGLALLVKLSGIWKMGGGAVGKAAVSIAAAKCSIPFVEAFFRGVLCNLLVCLAVWIALAGRNVTDRVVAIIFPISAFVAAGLEHSVANMYLVPLGILLQSEGGADFTAEISVASWAGFARNLIPVTLGNLTGGAGLVGLVYYIIYRRHTAVPPSST